MSRLVGTGGESVILRKTLPINNTLTKCAIKLAPAENTPKQSPEQEVFGVTVRPLDSSSMYQQDTPNELTAKSLSHRNIIQYFDSTFEVIDNALFHLTGKS